MAEKRKNKNKKNIFSAIIFIVLLIIAVVVFLYAQGWFDTNDETKPQTTVSESAGNISENNTEITEAENSSTSEADTETQTSDSDGNDGEYNPALPLTVQDAFDILKQKYGNDCRINMASSGEGFHSFTIVKNSELYATVKVNLSTGKAEETLAQTNKTTEFNLV